MPVSLDGKVVIVTGASAGLGRTSAVTFAKAGAKVVAADVDMVDGEETLALIKKDGGQAIFVKTDISRESDVMNMVEQTVQTYGRLDCAHNNAGIVARGPLTEITGDEWDKLMSVNLKGTWLCMKHEIIQMLKQHSGAIVNTSSITGLIGAPFSSLYASSKWGINGLTKAAAVEYAKSGIRVNSICPAGIKGTKMWASSQTDPVRAAKLADMLPMGRVAEMQEVAEAVLWLCSDAASFVTGINMPVDGGGTAA